MSQWRRRWLVGLASLRANLFLSDDLSFGEGETVPNVEGLCVKYFPKRLSDDRGSTRYFSLRQPTGETDMKTALIDPTTSDSNPNHKAKIIEVRKVTAMLIPELLMIHIPQILVSVSVSYEWTPWRDGQILVGRPLRRCHQGVIFVSFSTCTTSFSLCYATRLADSAGQWLASQLLALQRPSKYPVLRQSLCNSTGYARERLQDMLHNAPLVAPSEQPWMPPPISFT